MSGPLEKQREWSRVSQLRMGLLFVGYIVNFVDRSILSLLLEPIKLELALSDSQLGVLGGLAFALFYTFLGIPIAALADRRSRVKFLRFPWSSGCHDGFMRVGD